MGDFLSLLNQGLQMVEQADSAMQTASQPISNRIVSKAKQVINQILVPQPNPTGAPEFAGNMMDPRNGDIYYQGEKIASDPTYQKPQGYASGGAVNSAGFYFDPTGFINSRFQSRPERSMMGNPFGNPTEYLWTNRDSIGKDLNLFTNSELPDYMQQSLGSAATNGGEYGGILELINRIQRGQSNSGDGGPSAEFVKRGQQAQQWLNSLGAMSGNRSSSSAGNSSPFGGGSMPTTDAYGRPLNSIGEDESTALRYPGNPMTYGYGPEFNHIYYGGSDAMNLQPGLLDFLSGGYGYGMQPQSSYGYSNPFSGYGNFGGYGGGFGYGYAEGGAVDKNKQSPDYTAAPDLNKLKEAFVAAVAEGDMEAAHQLDELIQNRQMMEGTVPEDRMPTNGGFAKGGSVDMRNGGGLSGKSGGKDDNVLAYLSTGEHVIPAWAVAAAGDGNTEAGHAAFDKLMEALKEKHSSMAEYDAS